MTDPKAPNDLPVSNTPLFAANEKISKINVAEEIKNSFLDYSMSVIISRALPDVRDGLKPSQRRILYAMHDLSLFPNRQHRKCAKICGDTSGNYHPTARRGFNPPWSTWLRDGRSAERSLKGREISGRVKAIRRAAFGKTRA